MNLSCAAMEQKVGLKWAQRPRGNGVMDSSLACCAGGSLIPAVGKSNVQHSDGFSPSRYMVVGQKKRSQTKKINDLASPCSRNKIIMLPATVSMGKTQFKCKEW